MPAMLKLILGIVVISQMNYWVGYRTGKNKQLAKDQAAVPNVKLQLA